MMDQGEVIRVCVEVDEFYDFEPDLPKALARCCAERFPMFKLFFCVHPNRHHHTVRIQYSIAEQGPNGPVAWWKAAEMEGVEEMEEG